MSAKQKRLQELYDKLNTKTELKARVGEAYRNSPGGEFIGLDPVAYKREMDKLDREIDSIWGEIFKVQRAPEEDFLPSKDTGTSVIGGLFVVVLIGLCAIHFATDPFSFNSSVYTTYLLTNFVLGIFGWFIQHETIRLICISMVVCPLVFLGLGTIGGVAYGISLLGKQNRK